MRKSKSAKFKLLRPKFSLTPKSGAALLAILVCLGGAGYLASKKLSVSATTLDWCQQGNPNGINCFDRYRGETGEAAVVGHSRGAAHENFTMVMLNHYCNYGYVSGSCPFNTGTLNSRYYGDEVVQFRDNETGKCVGAYSFDRSETAEESCNDSYGNGGGVGTVFVYNAAGGGGTPGYLESKYWSNRLEKPVWLCTAAYPDEARFLSFSSTDLGEGRCQWHYVTP